MTCGRRPGSGVAGALAAHVEQARGREGLKAGCRVRGWDPFDPFAVRAWFCCCSGYFFGGCGERVRRIAAAFDWAGAVPVAEFPRRRLGDPAALHRASPR